MSDNSHPNEPLFQTPNPDELKQAAQADPIQDRPDAQESDSNQDHKPSEADGLFDTQPGSQVIRANISGH